MKLRPTELVGEIENSGLPLRTPEGWFAIDTECTGLDPWASCDRPFAVSICNADGETAYLRWPVNPVTRAVLPQEHQLAFLRKLLGDPKLTAVMHNRPYDKRMFRMLGIDVRCKIYDTLIAQHVINPDELTYALKPLCKKYLGIDDKDQVDLHMSAKKARVEARKTHPHWKLGEEAEADMWLADPKLCKRYAIEDSVRTAKLYLAQQQEMADWDEKRQQCLRDEFQLQDCIEAMEDRGIAIDLDKLEELKKYYTKIRDEAQRKIPKDLNPKSPKQMCEFFFGKKGYTPKSYSERDDGTPVPCPHCAAPRLGPDGKPVKVATKTKAGKPIVRTVKDSPGCKICQGTGKSPQCNGEYLASIAGHTDDDGNYVKDDNDAYWILRYDGAVQMLTSFMTPYEQLAVEDPANPGGMCLHPNYKQCGPVTGRLSCERPNMMQVAGPDAGRKHNDIVYRPRECFVARPGFMFYIPDYSQIEVWVFAHLAQDPTMMKILMEGGDFHGRIAEQVWGDQWDHEIVKRVKDKNPKDLTPEEAEQRHLFKHLRNRAKLLMFSKLYGGGFGAQADVMKCTIEEAKVFARDYDQRLPGVRRYMERMVKDAREKGYYMSPFGRFYPANKNTAYKITNYSVQGSSASIMKRAMTNMYQLSLTPKYKGKLYLLLTIHDELIIEVAKSIHSPQTMKEVVSTMQQDHKIIGCPKPFPVGLKLANERWSETEEVKL